jgi:hypothetical protein
MPKNINEITYKKNKFDLKTFRKTEEGRKKFKIRFETVAKIWTVSFFFLLLFVFIIFGQIVER